MSGSTRAAQNRGGSDRSTVRPGRNPAELTPDDVPRDGYVVVERRPAIDRAIAHEPRRGPAVALAAEHPRACVVMLAAHLRWTVQGFGRVVAAPRFIEDFK